jgi:hypothetical protein
MLIPTLITDLSTTAASNFPAGSDSPSSLDDVQRAHASFIAQLRDDPTANALAAIPVAKGGTGATTPAAARTALGVPPRATRIDVASVAGTVDLTTNAPDSDDIRITGALTVTGFTVAVGRVIRVTAGGAFTLTNNANIVTQTGANIVAASGDTFMLRATAANVVEVFSYSKASGVVIADGSITPAKLSQPLTAGTAVATTSGTAIDFTGIPSWVKQITVMLNSVSTNGSSLPQIRVGSGSAATSGYGCVFSAILTGNITTTSATTTGFPFYSNSAAASYIIGHAVLTLVSGTTWTYSANAADGNGNRAMLTAGNIVLGGALDMVRLTTVNGTDTFDAGSVNILYEG